MPKSKHQIPGRVRSAYAFIKPHRDQYGVQMMCRALEAPVINVDETRRAMMGSLTPAKGTVWTVRSPAVSFHRILLGKSADEGRQVLQGYRGTVVASQTFRSPTVNNSP